MIKSLLYFVAAGLCEIGGGYLVWLWLRENKPIWFALLGGAILILCGLYRRCNPLALGACIPHTAGVFVVLSILWGWQVDKTTPDSLTLLAVQLHWREYLSSCIGRGTYERLNPSSDLP